LVIFPILCYSLHEMSISVADLNLQRGMTLQPSLKLLNQLNAKPATHCAVTQIAENACLSDTAMCCNRSEFLGNGAERNFNKLSLSSILWH